MFDIVMEAAAHNRYMEFPPDTPSRVQRIEPC
jgi:hypothetical protein